MTAPIQNAFYFAPIAEGVIPEETPTAIDQLEVWHDPEAKRGIRPTIGCAERLMWFRDSRISELEQFAQRECPASTYQGSSYSATIDGFTRVPSIIPAVSREHMSALIEAAKKENPALIEQMHRDYLNAMFWEKKRYGNVAAHLQPKRFHL